MTVSPSRNLLASLMSCLLLCALGACGTDGAGGASGSSGPAASAALGARAATITGTVVDADSGAPVAGASIEGPGGARASSDAQGRFTLSGLPVGVEGELVARGQDGAEARNRLRPLRPGTLEVVLRLRRP
jgi:hypothetical protein